MIPGLDKPWEPHERRRKPRCILAVPLEGGISPRETLQGAFKGFDGPCQSHDPLLLSDTFGDVRLAPTMLLLGRAPFPLITKSPKEWDAEFWRWGRNEVGLALSGGGVEGVGITNRSDRPPLSVGADDDEMGLANIVDPAVAASTFSHTRHSPTLINAPTPIPPPTPH
ncbi:hypothetical protein B0H19DRAFT_1074302 [Mycena capillaripes]|nr:hypothetical protein B0H19DRAFT_1074302 [Mycena capillaripes]